MISLIANLSLDFTSRENPRRNNYEGWKISEARQGQVVETPKAVFNFSLYAKNIFHWKKKFQAFTNCIEMKQQFFKQLWT